MKTLLSTIAVFTASVAPAFAASTTTVYNSGILVLLFVGFCALVVTVQLIPAILTLWGMLMGILTNKTTGETADARLRK